MGRRNDTRGARTAFGDYEGQLEVDLPAEPRAPVGGEELKPLQRVGTRRRALVRRPSLVGPIFWVLLIGGVLGGGFYGYCRYRVAARQQAFVRELAGLRSALVELPAPLAAEDVRALVARLADRATVLAAAAGIEATVEPLSPRNASGLSDAIDRERSLAETAKGAASATALVVAIKAQLVASYGPVSEAFGVERSLRIDLVAPKPVGGPARR
ncbi:MAG: hypothetical protein IPG96_11740 [Proteobacteria bacterium]|nr:hypothetical protein [Pseudomonadota bacterium]